MYQHSWKQACYALFMAPVIASPAANPLAQPAANIATCADKCWSQISANREQPSSLAKAGCTNMFAKTVVPCPVTSTVSKTTVVVSTVSTTMVTIGSTTTVLATAFEASPYTATHEVTEPPTSTFVVLETPGPDVDVLRRSDPACTPKTISTTAVPTYFPACKSMAQYSSACSCFPVPHSTTTKSASTVSVTSTHTLTRRVTATSTVVAAPTPVTNVVTTIYTPTAIVTAVATEYGAVPTCTNSFDPSATPTACPTVYDQYGDWTEYEGQANGKVLNPNNPGNPYPTSYPPAYFDLSGCLEPCDAIQACMDTVSQPQAFYESFDVHYLISRGVWECVGYVGLNLNDASDYNVEDSDALVAYLYSAP